MSERSDLADAIIRALTAVPVHDEPMPGAWLCGQCPYANVGPICTKCGALRFEGRAIPNGDTQ